MKHMKTKTHKIFFYVRTGLIALAVVGLVTFIFLQSRALMFGPQISIISPLDGSTVTEDIVYVTGIAHHTQDLALNGEKIFMSPDGTFSEQITLPHGMNTLSLTAEDKFGKKIEKDFKIYVQESPDSLAILSQSDTAESTEF